MVDQRMSLLLATALVGCGDPTDGVASIIPKATPPEPAQAALTLELWPAAGAQCPWARNVGVPERPFYNFYDPQFGGPLAADGDGEHQVSCSVLPLSEPSEVYRVELRLESEELGEFRAEGTLNVRGTNSLKVQLSEGLEQADCEVSPPVLQPGALLLSSVDCHRLTNRNVPDAACSAQLTLRFERCAGADH
jgi:hypothetical protein